MECVWIGKLVLGFEDGDLGEEKSFEVIADGTVDFTGGREEGPGVVGIGGLVITSFLFG